MNLRPLGKAVALWLGITTCQAQWGTVLLQNFGEGLPAYVVIRPEQRRVPAGDAFTVQVLWGPDAGSVAMPLGRTNFCAPGLFSLGLQPIIGAHPGSQPFLRIQVWENPGGTIESLHSAIASGLPLALGESATFQLGRGLGEPSGTNAPPLLGMKWMSIGPMTGDLPFFLDTWLAAGSLQLRWATWEYSGWSSRLQRASDLSLPHWEDVPGSDATNLLTLPLSGEQGFFRILTIRR